MSLCGTALLAKALTWGTLSAALSSALWLAVAGDDDYPLQDWLADLVEAAASVESGSASVQAVAERSRAPRWAPPDRVPALR